MTAFQEIDYDIVEGRECSDQQRHCKHCKSSVAQRGETLDFIHGEPNADAERLQSERGNKATRDERREKMHVAVICDENVAVQGGK